jgi:hypothetical protein
VWRRGQIWTRAWVDANANSSNASLTPVRLNDVPLFSLARRLQSDMWEGKAFPAPGCSRLSILNRPLPAPTLPPCPPCAHAQPSRAPSRTPSRAPSRAGGQWRWAECLSRLFLGDRVHWVQQVRQGADMRWCVVGRRGRRVVRRGRRDGAGRREPRDRQPG